MRRLLLLLLFGAGLVVLPAGVASAADFVVNNSGDAGDAVKGNGTCATAGGACTLRAAVEEAEALSGADSITVPAMTISLGALLDISRTTTLQGAGARSTIITGTPGHILLRISGGDVQLRDLALQGATSSGGGGGLAIQQTGNAATTLQRVRVVGNSVSGSSNAYAALYVTAGDMTVRESEISGNSAVSTLGYANGGGIYLQGASTRLFVENSTIHANTATAGGSGAWGGGLFVYSGTATISSSTVTNNLAANSTSVAAYGGNVFNNTGSLTVRDSIIAGGTADIPTAANCYGTIGFTGRNLVSDTTCGTASATRTVGDPQLGPLQDNGGGTNSRSPALSSPAVDAIANCALPADQRGQQRPIGAGCDLGSAEVGADVTVSQDLSNTGPAPGSDVVFTAKVTNKGADSAAGGRFAATVQNAQSIVSVSASEGSCAVNGTAVTCDLGVVQRSGPRTILIVARAPQQGVLASSATVSSDLPDPNTADNASVVSAEVPAATPVVKACANAIKGTKKADRLRGTAKGDRISGLGGRDVLRGLGGADCLTGGKGKDRLIAGAGDDTIRSRDGVRDVVKCGAGDDRVVADRRDRVAKDCERVSKR